MSPPPSPSVKTEDRRGRRQPSHLPWDPPRAWYPPAPALATSETRGWLKKTELSKSPHSPLGLEILLRVLYGDSDYLDPGRGALTHQHCCFPDSCGLPCHPGIWPGQFPFLGRGHTGLLIYILSGQGSHAELVSCWHVSGSRLWPQPS